MKLFVFIILVGLSMSAISQSELSEVTLGNCDIPHGTCNSDEFYTVSSGTPDGHLSVMSSTFQITMDHDFFILKNAIFQWSYRIKKGSIKGYYNKNGQLSYINFYAKDEEGISLISLKGTKFNDTFMLFSVKIIDTKIQNTYMEFFCDLGNCPMSYIKRGCD